MFPRRYHDFVLYTQDGLEEGGGLASFTVHVFQSLAGEGQRKVRVPIPDYDDLETQQRRLARRKLDLGQQIELGQRLADLMLPPYARQFFNRSLAQLQSGEGMRLRLRLIPTLRAFPWEYLHIQGDGVEPSPSGFLALDPRISIVRHEAMAVPVERVIPRDTRRVVIAMASPEPYDTYPMLDYLPEELRKIRAALEEVPGTEVECLPDCEDKTEWETIPGARLDELQKAVQGLGRVDILHFSGHGDFLTEMGDAFGTESGEGVIVMADPDNQAKLVKGDLLAETIREHGIRLVTLGACKTGERDILRAWSSIAIALLLGRIPCVVAMQFKIYDDLAAAFMVAVYEALADGRTIDEAVFQGRAAIRVKSLGAQAEARDWGVPVLYSRMPDGRIFPPIGDEDARVKARQSVEQRTRLHEAWWEWMAYRATASKSQLDYLAEQSEALDLSPTQALILLRSAVRVEVPVDPWLGRLRKDGAELVAQLEDPDANDITTSTPVDKVLGLDATLRSGRVSHSAVNHPDEVTRHTAALALTALEPVPQEGLDRLDVALAQLHGRERWLRQAELLGTLADADPEIEALNARESLCDRFGVWLWRVRKRTIRDRARVYALTLGGAIGAGALLAVLRAIVAFLGENSIASPFFGIYSYVGAILGGAVGLATALSGPLVLSDPSLDSADTPTSRRPALAAVVLGTVFFGFAHMITAFIGGHRFVGAPLVVPMGFAAGLGLCLALYNQPRAGLHLGLLRWLLRLTTAAATFSLIHWVFVQGRSLGTGLAFVLSGQFYYPEFLDYKFRWWKWFMAHCDGWYDWMAIGDAALAGIVLTMGITAGLVLANDLLVKWKAVVDRERNSEVRKDETDTIAS